MTILPNEDQCYAIDLALSGNHCVIHGKAGTGKTTSLRFIVEALLEDHPDTDTKYRIQGEGRYEYGHPIAVVAFTRQAVRQAAKALDGLLSCEVTTIHNLLEYAPIKEYDPATNEFRYIMRPLRDRNNRLNQAIIIIDEMSMVGHEPLFRQIQEAAPYAQYILMGDINQLEPVHGHSVLYYALSQWPSVYLNQVYRQAADNPIIRQSLGLLENKSPSIDLIDSPIYDGEKEGVALILPKTGVAHGATAVQWQRTFFTKLLTENKFDPHIDKILSPYNVHQWGTVHINKLIATLLDERNPTRPIYHIISGVFSHYYAEGDVVMFNKEQWVIERIEPNPEFKPNLVNLHEPDPSISRWGIHIDQLRNTEIDLTDLADVSLDTPLDKVEDDKLPKQCSHHLHLRSLEGAGTAKVSNLGQYGDTSLDYCRTIHKSQGSQWRRIFLIMHRSQYNGRTREMLYTALTRAQRLAVIISDRDTLNRATRATSIKGHTIHERLEFLAHKYPANVCRLPEQDPGATPPPVFTHLPAHEPSILPTRDEPTTPARAAPAPVSELRKAPVFNFSFTK